MSGGLMNTRLMQLTAKRIRTGLDQKNTKEVRRSPRYMPHVQTSVEVIRAP